MSTKKPKVVNKTRDSGKLGRGRVFVFIRHVLAIYLASYLAFYPSAYASTTDWNFSTAGDYTYDPNKISVSGGVASLVALDLTDDANDATGFAGGTHSDTQWNSSFVDLTATGKTNKAGNFTSRIFDAGASVSWNGTFAWSSQRPSLKELPDNEAVENAYAQGNINMSPAGLDNRLLLHLNDANFGDGSGNAHPFTGNGGITTGTTNAKLNAYATFAGDNDYLSLADHADFDVGTGSFTIALWFKTSSAGVKYLASDYGAAGWKLWEDATGHICIGLDDDASWTPATETQLCTPLTYADGVWHHVAVVKTTNTRLEIFIDGASVASTTTLAGGSTTSTYYTAASGDDAVEKSDGWFNSDIGYPELAIGGFAATGVRFAVTLPQGQSITSATVNLYTIYGDSGSSCTWRGFKYPDSLIFRSQSAWQDTERFQILAPRLPIPPGVGNIPMTTATAAWTVPAAGNPKQATVTAIVQEILNQSSPAWVNGNHMTLYCYNQSGGEDKFHSWDGSGSEPSLSITYPSSLATLDNSAAMNIGSDSAAGSYWNGQMDEVAFFRTALSSTSVADIFKRAGVRMRFHVRSCNDNACAGETFMGPDGTADTYYEEQDANTTALPAFTLTNVPDNQYFQYKVFYETDDATLTPELNSVVLSPTHYNAGDPTIVNNTGVNFSTLANFVSTVSAGTVKYQISSDGTGTNWKYYKDGEGWLPASGYAQTNTAAEIVANKASIASGMFYFKAFLHSANGTQAVELDNVNLVYSAQTGIVTIVELDGSTVVSESGITDTYTVVLGNAPTNNVIINISGDADATVSPTSLTFTSGNWSTPQTVTVTAVDDSTYEWIHATTISHTAVSDDIQYNNLMIDNVVGNVTDNDTAPTVQFTTTSSSGAESSTAPNLGVSLSAAAGIAVSVDYSVQVGGTATGGGTDYTLATGTLNIPAGDTSGNVALTVVDDVLDENDETVMVDISNPVNATLGDNIEHIYTITDNDNPPTVAFSAASSNGAESVTPANLTVSLSAVSGKEVTVPYTVTGGTATGGGVDYTLANGNLIIAAGSTSNNIQPVIVNNSVVEPNETIIVTLSAGPTNATLGATTSHTYTINNDDTAGVTVTQSGGSTAVTEGGATDTYTLVLTSEPTAGVEITVTGNADASVDPSPLTFTSGNWSTPQTVTVTAVNDVLEEVSPETATISHTTTPVASADSNYNGISVASVSASVTDNDNPPTVTLGVDNANISETGGVATLTATLSAASGQNVTVNLSYSGTATNVTDYTRSGTSIVINAGGTTGTATVTAAADTLDENNETVIVDISSVTNGTESGTQQVTTTITDDDATPSVTFTSASQNVAESTATMTATLQLSAASGLAVSVPFTITGTATGNGTDYSTAGAAETPIKNYISTSSYNGGPWSYTMGYEFIPNVNGQITHIWGYFNGTKTCKIWNTSQTVLATASVTSNYAWASTALASPLNVTAGTAYRVGCVIAGSGGSYRSPVVWSGSPSTDSANINVTAGYYSAGDAYPGTYGGGEATLYGMPDITFVPGSGGATSPATIAAGSTTANLTFTLVNDALSEDDETIIVTMGSPTGAAQGATTVHTGTIQDNDAPVNFAAASQSSAGESGTMTVTAQLSAALAHAVTVPFTVTGTATGSGTDYSITASPITINAGDTTGTATITITGDTLDEADETVIVTMGTPTGAAPGATTVHTATITDDDATPTVTFTAASQNVAESTSTMTATLQLSAASSFAVSVPFEITGTATGSGTDYSTTGAAQTPCKTYQTANPTTTSTNIAWNYTMGYEFIPNVNGQITHIWGYFNGTKTCKIWNTSQTVLATASVTSVNAWASTALASPLNVTAGTAYRVACVLAGSGGAYKYPAVYSGANSTDSANINVTSGYYSNANAYPASPLTTELYGMTDITFVPSSGGASSPATIAAGSTTANLTFGIVNDTLDEADETIIVTMGSPTNATQGAAPVHTGTILDNDASPTVTFTTASQSSANESGTMTVTAQISAASGQAVTVPFTVTGTATGGATDYSITASPITVNAGATTGTATITITGDTLDEVNETVIVTMGTPTGATQGATTVHTATITDDDATPTIAFTATSSSGNEDVTPADLELTLSAASGLNVTVNYAVTGTATGSGTDFTLANGTATITAGSTTTNISPIIVNDLLTESDETIVVTISSPANASLGANTVHTYTINSNDLPVATTSGEPTDTSKITTLGVTVGGTDITNYKYKVGVSGSTDCTSAADYSAERVVATTISDSISGISDGAVKLCVVGKNSAGTWQEYGSATEKTWTKDATAPSNQDTVFVASVTKKNGDSVTIVSSGDATNNVWFAPFGTTSFAEGTTMTKAASGTATSIAVPANAGSYRLFVIDAVGNISPESAAILTVDNTAPTAAISYSPAGGLYKSGVSVTITATFSEPVLVSPVPKIAISGSNTVSATNMTRTDDTHYTYLHAVEAGNGTATVAMSVGTDAAGNIITAAPTSGADFTVDNTAPSNQDTVFAASVTKKDGDTVTIVSSGDVTNNVWFAPSGTTNFVEGTTMTKAASGTATSIAVPADAGIYYLFVKDAAGNLSNASTATLTVDNTVPTAAITYSPAGPYKSDASVTITATFSEPVLNSPVPKIAISGANTVSATDMTKSSTTVYTYVHTVGAGNGTATVAMSVGTDAAGNVITAAPTSGADFTVDNAAPTAPSAVTIVSGSGWNTNYISNVNKAAVKVSGTKSTDTTRIFIEIDDENGFTNAKTADLTGLGATTTYADSTGIDVTTATALGDGSIALRITAYDEAGNSASQTALTTAETFKKDIVAPSGYTVSINQSYLNIGNKTAMTFTFADAEVGTTYNSSTDDTNGGTSAVVVSGSVDSATQISDQVNTAPLDDGTLTVTAYLTDAAGNSGSNTTDTVSKDTDAPALYGITTTTPNGTYNTGDEINVQVVFDKAVTLSGGNLVVTLEAGLVDRDVTISTISNTDTVNGTYTVQAGDISSDLAVSNVALSAGTLRDAAGNDTTLDLPAGNNLSNNAQIVIDTVAPTMSSASVAGNNSYIDVTMGKGVYTGISGNNGSGAVTASDFGIVFAANGGTASDATISSVKNTSNGDLSGGESVIRVNLSITGTPSGTETVTITPASGSAIYDYAGNAMAAGQTTGAKTLGDQKAPTVTNVTSSTADGSYKAGSVIAVQVVFSESVNVTGVPQITLQNGGGGSVVNYTSGTGTNTLLFNYTIQAGDTNADLDYVSTSALALNSGTIKDAALNSAILTLASPGAAGSLGNNKAIIVDTTAPSVAAGADKLSRAQFLQDATVTGATSYQWSKQAGTGTITFGSATSEDTTISSDTDGAFTIRLTATDAAGNSAFDDMALTWDVTAPTITGGVLAVENTSVTVNTNEGVYSTGSGSGALEASDFSITFVQNGGTATNASITGVTKTDGNALAGGETSVKVNISVTGTPSGVETVAIKPADGSSIFDAAGNTMVSGQTTGAKTLNDKNDAPTDISISASALNENQPIGTVVGNLTTTDPNEGESQTYTLVAGTGSTDNSSFTINGAQLRSAEIFDYEVKNSYSVRVRSTDTADQYTEKAFTITIGNVNDVPTLTAVSTLPDGTEDTGYNVTYAVLAAAANEADADVGDAISFRVEAVNSGTLTKGGAAVTPSSTLLSSGETWVWTPASNANGTLNAFTVKAYDGTAVSASAIQVQVSVASVNDVPTLTAVSTLPDGTEDTGYNVTYAALATAADEADADSDTISFKVMAVSTGSLTKNGDAVVAGTTVISSGDEVVWTPALNANGTLNAFTVKAYDGTAASASAIQVQVSVASANDVPTLTSISTLPDGTEDTGYNVTYAALAAAANEADADAGDAISFRVEAVSSGTLTKGGAAVTPSSTLLSSGETWVWTPASNANGTLNAFTVKAYDGTAVSSSAIQVQVSVASVNDVPTLTAINTIDSATEDAPKTITYAGLAEAADEADADSDTISFKVMAVSTGSLTKNGDAVVAGTTMISSGDEVVWTPASNANGTLNAFTVKAYDGTAVSASAIQVQVSVASVNDVPTLTAVSTLSNGTEDTGYNVTYAALATAADEADADSDTISFKVMAVSTGSLTKNGDAVVAGTTMISSGDEVVWTPASNANGTLNAFTVKAYDGTAVSASAIQVQVSVASANDVPTLTSISTLPDGTEDTGYNVTYAVLAAAANEADADVGDAISFRVEAVNSGTLTKGGAAVTPSSTLLSSGETWVWTPASNANGTLNAFTVKAYDGTAVSSSAIQVQVSVASVNDVPTLTAVSTLFNGTEDTGYNVTYAALAAAADETDADTGDAISFRVEAVSSGTLTKGGVDVTQGSTLLSSDETWVWTPASNANGTLNAFTVKAYDGVAASSSAIQVRVGVASINDAPVVSAISITTNEDTLGSTAAIATDVEGSALTYSIVAQAASGTCSVAGSNIRYMPAANTNGSYSCTYKAFDGTSDSNVANVAITVGAINDAPTLASIGNRSVSENALLTFVVTGNDVDLDSLTYSASNLPSGASFNPATRTFTWTPDNSQAGSYVGVSFSVSDGIAPAISEAITITVSNTDRAPTFTASVENKTVAEGATLTFTLSAADADSDTITYSTLVSLPSGATLDSSTGAFAWTPTYAQAGTYNVTFRASSGNPALSIQEAITITVTNTNRAPTLTAIGNKSVNENSALNFTVVGSDPDGDAVTFSVSGLPSGANFNPSTRAFAWTPNLNQSGSYQVAFTVTDGGGLGATETITIVVNNTNSPPVIGSIPSQNATEGVQLMFSIPTSDQDGDPLTMTFAQNQGEVVGTACETPVGATITKINNNSFSFRWTPSFNASGFHCTTVAASDGAATTFRQILISVSNVNRPPMIAEIAEKYVVEGATLTFQLQVSEPDGDGVFTGMEYQTLSGFRQLPSAATFNAGTRTFTWTPGLNDSGEYRVKFIARDNVYPQLEPAIMYVNIHVTDSNRAPTISAVAQPAAADGRICQQLRSSVVISVTGTDLDGGTLTYTMTGKPSDASFSTGSGSNRVFQWAPTAVSSTTVSFVVTDAGGLTASATYNIVAVATIDQCADATDEEAAGDDNEDDGPALPSGLPTAKACFGNLTDTQGVCVSTRIVRSRSTVKLDARNSYQPATLPSGTITQTSNNLIYHWQQVSAGGCTVVELSDNNSTTATEPSFKVPEVEENNLIQCQFDLYVENEFGMSAEASRATVRVVADSSESNAIEVPYGVYGQVEDGVVVSDPELSAQGSAATYNSRLSADESSTSSTVLSIVNTKGKITNLTDFTQVERVSSMTVPGAVHTYNFKIAEAATGAAGTSQYVITMPNYDSNRGAIFKFDRESLRSTGQGGMPVDVMNDSRFGIDRFYGSAAGEFLGAGMTFADTDEDGITDLMFKRRDVANSASYIVGLTGGNYMGRAVTVDDNTFSFMIGGQDVDLRSIVITNTTPATTNNEMGYSQGPMIGFGVQGQNTMTVDIRNDIYNYGGGSGSGQVVTLDNLYDRLAEEGRAKAFTGYKGYDYGQYMPMYPMTNPYGGSISVMCPAGYEPPSGFTANGCDASGEPASAGLSKSASVVNAAESGESESAITAESTNTAMGDINNDGYDDTIVGDSSAGYVYVFYGTATNNGAGDASEADVMIQCASTSDACGDVIIVGDLSGDGYDDIIIGAPNADGQYEELPNAGEIYIVYGDPALTGAIDVATYAQMNVIYGSTEAGYLGLEMVIIDADNNGVEELACNLRSGGAIIVSFDNLRALGRTLRVDQLGLTTTSYTDPDRVVMMKMNLSASMDEDILIDSLTLAAAGTGSDDSDVAAILIFEDTNHSGEFDSGDVQIGSSSAYDYDDGHVVFTGLGKTLPANEDAMWFVVYEFSNDGTSGLSIAATKGASRAILPLAILMTTVLVIAARRSKRLRVGVFAIMFIGQSIYWVGCHEGSGIGTTDEISGTYTYQVNISDSANIGAKGATTGEAADVLGAPMTGTEVSVTYTNGQPGATGFQGGGGCDASLDEFGDTN